MKFANRFCWLALFVVFFNSAFVFAVDSLNNNDTENRIQKAYRYYNLGKIDEAEKIYNEIIKKEPENFAANFGLGIIYQSRSELDKGISRFEICTQIDANYAPTYNNLGWLYFKKGDYDKAQFAFIMATQLDPNYFLAYNNLAVTYIAAGDFQMAKYILEKLLKADPYNGKALNNLGLIYYRGGDLEKASALFEAALKVEPDGLSPLVNLAKIYQERGQLGEARRNLFYALKNHPSSEIVQFSMGNFYFDMGDLKRSKAFFEKTLKIDKNHPGAKFFLAEMLRIKGKHRESIKFLKSALRAAPSNSLIYRQTGLNYANLGEYKTAEVFYRKALAYNVADPVTWNLLGESLERQGRRSEAYSDYYQATFLKNNYVDALLNLTRLQVEERKFSEATANIRFIDKIAPENYMSKLLMAIILWDEGKKEEAERLINSQFRKNIKRPKNLFMMGVFLIHEGKTKEGAQYFKKSISKNEFFLKEIDKFPRIKMLLKGLYPAIFRDKSCGTDRV